MFTLDFYATDKPYGCFSNFSRHPLVIDGSPWPTSEHYFQACKFPDTAYRDEIRNARTPFLAAQMGRNRSQPLRADWEQVRDNVMRMALAAKFTQHADLRDILLSTGDCLLVEHTANDSYWADGGDGSGLNRLGLLLMEWRDAQPGPRREFFAPPWVAHPRNDASDMFWRMGGGESYLTASARWRQGLSAMAGAHYDAYFPVPEGWTRSW